MIPEDTALVVVDMQEFLIDQYSSKELARVIDMQNSIIGDFREAGCPVIFTRYDVSGRILEEIDRTPEDTVVDKKWFDGFYKTSLLEEILETGKSKVIFVGAHGLDCLKETVNSGNRLLANHQVGGKQYKTYVAKNAMLTADWYTRNISLAQMEEAGARIITYAPYVKVGEQLEFLF